MDVPRTAPNVPIFNHPIIQKSLERLLYIWGVRWVSAYSTSVVSGGWVGGAYSTSGVSGVWVGVAPTLHLGCQVGGWVGGGQSVVACV